MRLPNVRRLLLLFGIFFAFTALTGCSGNRGTDPNSDAIEGTYALRTVDGRPLPYTNPCANCNGVTILADTLTMGRDASWTERVAYPQTVYGEMGTGTRTFAGTWTRVGSRVDLSTKSVRIVYTGRYAIDTLELKSGGNTSIFTR